MPYKDLGRVLGLSAFEEWKTRNPGGTWEEYQESLKGIDGEAGPPGVDGKSAYELWIEQGNKGTIEEFFNSFKGVGIVDKRLIGKNDNGDYIYRDVYSDRSEGPEYLSPRGPRGYTGGTVGGEDPPPPTGVPYGTIAEGQWGELPSGWVYTNGGLLPKGRYPHLIGFLPVLQEPVNADYKLTGDTVTYTSSSGSGGYSTNIFTLVNNSSKQFKSRWYNPTKDGQYWGYIQFYACGVGRNTATYEADGRRKYLYPTLPDKGNNGFLFEIQLPERLYISALAIDSANLKAGGAILTDYDQYRCSNRFTDIYFNIEYLDANGDWLRAAQLHNKTDFIESKLEHGMSMGVLKSPIRTTKIRVSIDPKSQPNYIDGSSDIYYIGKSSWYLDKVPWNETETIALPNEKDNQGRYKIVYVGQPLAPATGATISTYNAKNVYSGEISLANAIDNKIPFYAEGITMTPVNEPRLGYANKYNKKTDTWGLVRTHENQEGYYYNDLGDLKYTPKSNNYSIWDTVNHTWNESQELKEQEKQRLTDELIALEIKKDKMVDLNLETNQIMEKIKLINKEIENINR